MALHTNVSRFAEVVTIAYVAPEFSHFPSIKLKLNLNLKKIKIPFLETAIKGICT
jgi:hypothetical protein